MVTVLASLPVSVIIMFIQLGLMPPDLLLVMPDLLLQFLNGILMVVYLLLVVFGSLLLQLGKLLFLLKLKIETSAHSLPELRANSAAKLHCRESLFLLTLQPTKVIK